MNHLPVSYTHLDVYQRQAVRFIIRREIIHKYDLRFMEGIYHEDEQWTPRVLCTSETFSVIKPTIYNYRLGNSNSIMGMVNPKKSYCLLYTSLQQVYIIKIL